MQDVGLRNACDPKAKRLPLHKWSDCASGYRRLLLVQAIPKATSDRAVLSCFVVREIVRRFFPLAHVATLTICTERARNAHVVDVIR